MSNILKKSISIIEKNGILLVYPIDNRKQPPSIWSELYPKTPMRWEWDSEGDQKVAQLWHLREELSRSGKVIYAKWYQGRATFFSKKMFVAFKSVLASHRSLSSEAMRIWQTLKLDSPLSTKEIKLTCDLKGKVFESTYQKAMKELWSRLLIVGFGEKDDGAFPSLAVGASALLFEELDNASKQLNPRQAKKQIESMMDQDSLFLKHLNKLEAQWAGSTSSILDI